MHRDRFPGLADGWARFDGAAGSLVLDAAAAAVGDYLAGPDVANVHAPFVASERTGRLVDECRGTVAPLLGATPEGLVLGPSATALLGRLAAALEHRLSPGDELVVTELDHDANVSPWLDLAARTGATVRVARVDPENLELSAGAVACVLGDRTRVVAVTAASNVTGSLPDVEAIARLAKAAGALLVVDAVHAVPHAIDASGWDADAVVCSAYKWFGPHVGALALRPELMAELRPPRIRPAPSSGPGAWERGSLPFELLPGVTAAARYLAGLDRPAVLAHESALLEAMVTGLGGIDRVTLIGAPHRRTSTVAFNVAGREAQEVARALAAHRVAVGWGSFYAVGLMDRLGLPGGLVRAGALHYTDLDDVDRLVEAVAGLS